jgi:uncharacterized protein YjbI with pentapeptide repeats
MEKHEPPARSVGRAEKWFRALTLLIIAALVVWFVRYAIRSSGAARVNALFAGGLVLMGGLLLGWSYVRRPHLGQDEDFLDKLLAGIGQAVLLGAVLTFGFGIVNQRLEAERAATTARQNNAQAVRNAVGGKDLREMDLSGQNLGDLDMHGFSLVNANLAGANLSDANLSHALLSFATLTNAYLADAKLVGAWLYQANLSHADLSEADLSGGHLQAADLSGANLSDAHLSGADLADVIYDKHTVWPTGFNPPASASHHCTGRFCP